MRNNYVQELEALHNKLLGLGKAAETSVNKATQAYIESDTELAHEVFSDDLRINATTAEIEKDTHKIIALQQPVAQDLRMLFAVLHVSIDLERIADHAVSIGTIALRNQDHDEESQTVKGYLARMAQVAEKMIADALDSYISRDAKKARKVALMDAELDELLEAVYRDTAERMERKRELIPAGIDYLGVAGSLERIGDYVTNICERVVFLNTGEIVELN